jgi:hypothetical protein
LTNINFDKSYGRYRQAAGGRSQLPAIKIKPVKKRDAYANKSIEKKSKLTGTFMFNQ